MATLAVDALHRARDYFPRLVDTDASRPWFEDMSGALSPDEAAADVLWLATLPTGTREPYGELVQYRKVLPFTPPG